MNRDLSPVAGAPCTAPPIRHADSAEPYCASSPSRARSPVSPCRVDAKPGSPMPPPLQPSGPLRSREDQPSGRVRFQSATWVRITAAATAEWDVLLKDQHEGYISWSEFERNQQVITDNATGKGSAGLRGAVRR